MGVHDGHRNRLKERYNKEGLSNFQDHEVLELLLFYSIPQKDTNPIAHKLLEHFGSLGEVFNASVSELTKVDGITENSAVLISMIPKLMGKVKTKDYSKIPLDTADMLCKYCKNLFYSETTEKLRVVCLDNKLKVIGCEEVSSGTMGKIEFNARSIVEIAIKYRTDIVVLTHNHPRGASLPSNADLSATTSIKNILSSLGIKLLDHVIVGQNDVTSLKNDGFMFDL